MQPLTLSQILGFLGACIVVAIGLNFLNSRREKPVEKIPHKPKIKLRLVVRVGQLILQGGSTYPMNVDKNGRFQLAATDQYGNVIPGATFTGVQISGDTTFGSIVADAQNPTDPSFFSIAPSGKVGTDPLSLAATVNGLPLTGTLNVAIGVGAPAKLTASEIVDAPAS